MAKPKNKELYARVKAEAKRKFKVYPSAYANAWILTRKEAVLTNEFKEVVCRKMG